MFKMIEHAIGKYIISDHVLTEEEWARERATVIDETPIEECRQRRNEACDWLWLSWMQKTVRLMPVN